MTVTVTVQCVACKARKEIVAGDVSPGSVPFCDRCHNPMVAVSAKAKLDPNGGAVSDDDKDKLWFMNWKGMRIIADPTLPAGEIRMEDLGGQPVTVIRNLGEDKMDPNEEHLKAHPQYPRKGRGKKGR